MPTGYSLLAGDRNDGDNAVYPGAEGDGRNTCATDGVTFVARTNNANGYQWQVNAGTGFQDLQNNFVYTGSNTKYLTLAQPPTAWYGYKYRCAITSGTSTSYSPEYVLKFRFSWKGTASDAWENPLNWGCNKVPDAFTAVAVNPGQPLILRSNVKMRTISLQPGAHFTIASGKTLDVKSEILIEAYKSYSPV